MPFRPMSRNIDVIAIVQCKQPLGPIHTARKRKRKFFWCSLCFLIFSLPLPFSLGVNRHLSVIPNSPLAQSTFHLGWDNRYLLIVSNIKFDIMIKRSSWWWVTSFDLSDVICSGGSKIFLISCSFWENLATLYVGAPSYGESWIRPWYPRDKNTGICFNPILSV